MRKGFTSHPLYTIWCNIKRRCYVQDAQFYNLYGGNGVTMCEEWKNSFRSFYDWCINNGWKRGLQIDKDLLSKEKPGKLYSPETCSIITPLQNIRNRTTTEFLEYNGENLCVQEWAERLNINYKVVWQRLKNGWTLERMFKEPGLVEHVNKLNYKGEFIGITELSRRFNMSVNCLQKRLKKGWSIEKALETPVDQRYVTNKKIAA